MKIEFYRHNIETQEIEAVKDVLSSVFLTTGPVTAEFEKKFSAYTGINEIVGLNSCTAALHLSLLAFGVGPGDEVITTPMTFIATATAILHTGAVPVFVDVESQTGLIDVNKIEAAITDRTRAIIPVHLYGTMVDMMALKKIADLYHLKIVEDCAHCIEAERDGIRPGQLGDTACYSFYATKNLTCGEGGAVATNDPELAGKLRQLRQHGMSKDASTRYTGFYKHWDMVSLGWKYNMDDIRAALLVSQIDRLGQYWERRNTIYRSYNEGFQNNAYISTPAVIGKSAHHLYTIWVDPDKRDAIIHAFQKKEIGVAVNYRAIHMLTYFSTNFGYTPQNYPNAYQIGRSTISLPFYPKLRDHEIAYVIDRVIESVI